MRPGDPSVPIIYEVDRIRDGSSFATRRVVAIQHGKAIFSLSASFQFDEDGFDHQVAMPKVAGSGRADGRAGDQGTYLANAPENVRRYWERQRPIEIRPVSLEHYFSRDGPSRGRTSGSSRSAPFRTTASIQAAVLAYLSDMTLLDTALLCAWHVGLRPGPAGREPRPCHVVPSALPHGRLAALYPGQSERFGARGMTRGSLFTTLRRADCLGCAGRLDSEKGN